MEGRNLIKFWLAWEDVANKTPLMVGNQVDDIWS